MSGIFENRPLFKSVVFFDWYYDIYMFTIVIIYYYYILFSMILCFYDTKFGTCFVAVSINLRASPT